MAIKKTKTITKKTTTTKKKAAISVGVIHIHSTANNTIITATDDFGNTIS
jgi:small subunit ribosomal protein S11